MRIYLDNCCFNRPYDDQSVLSTRIETEAKLHIQGLVKDGDLKLAWSYILDFENGRNPFIERKTEIALWRGLAEAIAEPAEAITPKANGFADVGLKPLDALHLACAVYSSCEYFLTVDRGILKKRTNISGINIMTPIEFLDVLKEALK